MAINMNAARKLCTKAELELVQESAPTKIGELSERELRTRVRRARTLRDKYQTLASRQRRIARGKQEKRGANPSTSNENTIRKQEIFDQVLTRFETKLGKLEAAAEKEGSAKANAAARARRKAAPKRRAAKGARRGRGSKALQEDGEVGEQSGGKGGGGEASSVAAPKAKRGGKKKAKKPAARSAAKKPSAGVSRGGGVSELLGTAGLPGLSGLAGAGGTGALGLASHLDGQAARNVSLQTRSKASKGKRVQRRQDAANRPAIRGHVSARGRRNQARRDSK
jgi:hypothetical protein